MSSLVLRVFKKVFMVSTISLFVSAHYGFILFVNAVSSSFVFAVPSLFYMVWLWLKWKIFLFLSSLYGIEDFFILWMQSFLLLFKQCPSKCLWFQWFIAFSLRSMVSMVSSFQACSDFFLCLSGVITIPHGMVVVLMGKSSFFFAYCGFNDFFVLMDAVISFFV